MVRLKTDICNYADNDTICSCAKSVNGAIENLQSDLKIALKWFKDIQMLANSGILLGWTIYNKLNFRIRISNICEMARAKVEVLGRIRNRFNLSQAKISYNSFILSQFNNCCFVWMFHCKTLQNKINQIQKKALRIVYNEPSCHP